MSKQHFYRPGEALCDAPILYRGAGLEGIYLCNGYAREQADGEWFTHVKDIEELHHVIALHLVASRKVLSPVEIRFIRIVMDKTQSEVARMLGVTSQSVARWEKGQTEMPGPADRMLRIKFLVHVLPPEEFGEYVSEQNELLDELDQIQNEPVSFVHNPDDGAWTEQARPCERELELA